MKKLNAKELGIGALAGLTAALLVYGATVQPLLFILFGALSALPILIVGLGWGNIAVIAAVVVAGIVGTIAQSFYFGLFVVLLALIPAWLSHLANLARPASELGGPDNLMAWYPLSDIMLYLCGLAAVVIIVAGAVMGYNADLVGQVVDLYAKAMNEQQPSLPLDPIAIQKTKSLMLYAIPVAWGMIWVMMLLAAYYVATRIVAASSHNLRPREDIPSSLRMNRNAIFVFLVAIVAIFLGGVIGLIAAAVLGAFGAGFIVSGFASLHYRTRGKDWRIPVLVICYLMSFLLTLPLFIILVLGLSDTRKAISLTPNKNADTSKQTDTKI
ncbi:MULTISPECIES: DUF2232 domain-containing protein [unclassified Rhizobium]|uniref:DUF2232 domain-containing protein n=1 Tax=unclassified Rhizobium TaxID=2613769 RepID=UPI000EAA5DDE|nr:MULTISPECIES: DUF2232 domain-containing protein [unclassified Rhizobium]AYG68117.1 DUF2232 domain-containing protein [Rhizobium sp. CCGE531]AYG74507.1 DUF2232 domain-containing protein [Rhizobium sp. CCGE532]